MSAITLRGYQSEAINNTIAALRRSRRNRIILEMPTGGGKTIVFSYIVAGAEKKKSNTLILTDRRELLNGTGSTLEKFFTNPTYVTANTTKVPRIERGNGCTFVGMAQTLKRRIDKPDWLAWLKHIDLVIIDEAHKQEFNKFFKLGLFDGKTVIGVTATPERGGRQRQLGEDYDEIVHTLTIPELIDMGFLMPDMYYGFSEPPSMKGVKRDVKGDYSESDMFKRYNTPKLYGGLVEMYKKHVPNTTMIVFCTNIIHCVRTAKELCAAGIPAKFLTSGLAKPKMPKGEEPLNKITASAEWIKYWEKLDYWLEYMDSFLEFSGDRDKVVNSWKSGEFKVLVNAGILTTGFDFPAIETVALFRATVSTVLYCQMLGRGSRPCEEIGKTHFNILDFGGNASRLGGYRLPRKWSLFHESKSGSGVPPLKECGESGKDKNGKMGCKDYILASAKICPNCGYIYPEQKIQEAKNFKLMSTDKDGKMRAVKPINQMSFSELEEFASENRYKKNWINIQIFARGGLLELKKYAKFKNYSLGWVTRIESFIPERVKSDRAAIERELKKTKTRQL